VKSSARNTCRGRKRDVNMESMLPPKRTKTVIKNLNERGAKTNTWTDGMNEVIDPLVATICTSVLFFFHVLIDRRFFHSFPLD
jgi:hypothetical protein